MKDAYFEGKVAVVTGAGGTLCSVIAKGAGIALKNIDRFSFLMR